MKTRNLFVMAMHVVVSAALAAVTAFAVFVGIQAALTEGRAATLQTYIRVRAEREQTLFEQARIYIEAAEQAFLRRLEQLDPDQVEAEFERIYPDYGDGTRRSAPAVFEGEVLPGGDYVFGIGAFLADAQAMTDAQRHRYLSAFHTVRSVGEAHLNLFSSLYYFTPDRRVVIFAPNRPDRLEFYRITAPADFQLQADEDPRLFSLETNPDSAMQCTRLSRFVYSDGGERSATACRKPLRVGGELLGAFGTSIDMTGHLARTLETPPAGGINMMFDREGDVIARGAAAGEGGLVNPVVIMSLLQDDPRPRGIVTAPDGDHLIAFGRIPGPDWYFVSVVPMADIQATAQHRAAVIFAIVMACSLGFAALRGVLRRLRPVRRLVRMKERPRGGPGNQKQVRLSGHGTFFDR